MPTVPCCLPFFPQRRQEEATAKLSALQTNLTAALAQRSGPAVFDAATPAAMAVQLCDDLLGNKKVPPAIRCMPLAVPFPEQRLPAVPQQHAPAT